MFSVHMLRFANIHEHAASVYWFACHEILLRTQMRNVQNSLCVCVYTKRAGNALNRLGLPVDG